MLDAGCAQPRQVLAAKAAPLAEQDIARLDRVGQDRTFRLIERETVEPHELSRWCRVSQPYIAALARADEVPVVDRRQPRPERRAPTLISTLAVPGSPAHLATGRRRLLGPLLLLALALVPVTWWLPLFTARIPFLWRQEVSIASGLLDLWRLDLVLCLVVLFFSVLAPLAKGAALVWVWYRVPAHLARRQLDRLAILGKLAMTEIFLLAVIIVGLKGVGIGRSR
jgi:hypothetical protein